MKKIVLLMFTVLLYSHALAGGAGTTAFQVLNIPMFAYDASLANINIIQSQNPSLIPFNSYSFTFTQVLHLVETKYSVASVSLPVSQYSGLGVSVILFDYGSMPRTYSNGSGGYIEDGQFGATDKVVTLSYGLSLSDSFSGGLSMKYLKQEIDDVSYTGFAGSVSMLYFADRNFTIGTGLNNFGEKIGEYSLPTNLYLAISGNVSEKTSLIAEIDNYYNDDLYELKLAAETGFEKLMFRIGYTFPLKKQSFVDTNSSTITNFTLGIGLNFDFLFIDYAWMPKGDLGNIHMFSVMVRI